MLPEALMMMIWFIDNCLFILVWNLKCFIVGIAISSAFIMVLKLVLSFQLLFLPQVILVFFFFLYIVCSRASFSLLEAIIPGLFLFV